jgi:hypothetical protein
MRYRNIGPKRQQRISTHQLVVMRTALDQRHSIEFTFIHCDETQYRIVTSDFDKPAPTINEARHRTTLEAAFERMIELFLECDRAIASGIAAASSMTT